MKRNKKKGKMSNEDSYQAFRECVDEFVNSLDRTGVESAMQILELETTGTLRKLKYKLRERLRGDYNADHFDNDDDTRETRERHGRALEKFVDEVVSVDRNRTFEATAEDSLISRAVRYNLAEQPTDAAFESIAAELQNAQQRPECDRITDTTGRTFLIPAELMETLEITENDATVNHQSVEQNNDQTSSNAHRNTRKSVTIMEDANLSTEEITWWDLRDKYREIIDRNVR